MRRVSCVYLWLAVGACSSGPPDAPTDSGVPTEWTIVPTAFSVGGTTNDELYTLSQVVGATRLSDGRVIVADHYVQGLRAFDSQGVYLTTVGGEGQGPGEYRFIRGLGPCEADRVVAFDINWDQTVYLEDLTLVEQRPPELPVLDGSPYQYACAPNGYAVATGWGGQFQPGFFVATAPVVLIQNGQLVHNFGERLSSERIGTLGGTGPHPFGRQTSVAIGNDLVFLGDGSDNLVEVYDLEGVRVGTISWEGPTRGIEERHYDVYAEARLRSADPLREPAIRREVSNLPRLEQFPAYDELVVDGGGDLWVRTFPEPGAAQVQWTVFSPAGALLGTVRVPTYWKILEIGVDYLLVVETDGLGVETVRMMDLGR